MPVQNILVPSSGSSFIASGIAIGTDDMKFTLAYEGSPILVGDVIKVIFPVDFPVNGTLRLGSGLYMELRDLNGELVTNISSGTPVILAYASSYWITQYELNSSMRAPIFERFSENAEITPDIGYRWNIASAPTVQYIAQNTTNDFVTIFDKIVTGMNDSVLDIDIGVSLGSATISSSVTGPGSVCIAKLETIYQAASQIQYEGSSSSDSEGNTTGRYPGIRRFLNLRKTYTNVAQGHEVRIILSFKAGIMNSNSSANQLNVAQITTNHGCGYACNYFVNIAHYA